jgi:hypothetical protein
MEDNMQRFRYGLIVAGMLLSLVTSVEAQISIGIGLPSVSIGINLPLFPELVRVQGYPVYYAPRMDANYFFYDGMYWVYLDDNWYASTWYNGPWGIVDPYYVPLYILRIPVRYYRQPPVYFREWQSNSPPRWGQHWGHNWEQRRSGWNRWNRRSAPAPAPLPVYQRQYSGDRYPRQIEQQHTLRSQHYRYQPRDKVVQQHFKQVEQKVPAPAQRGRQEAPSARSPSQVDQRQQQQQKQQIDQRQQQQQKQQNDQRQQQQQKQQNDQRQQQQQKQQNDQRLQQQQKQQNDQRQQQQQKQQNDQRQQQQQKQQNDQRQQQQQKQQNDQRLQQQKQQNDQRQQQQQKQQNDQRLQQQQKQQNDQRLQQQQQQKQLNDQRQQQQAPKVQERVKKPQDTGESQEPNRGQGQNKDEERGRGRDK